MYRIFFLALSLCFLMQRVDAQPVIDLQVFATGLNNPVDIAHCGDDRLFIVERAGRIRIVQADGTVLPDYFLDITDQIESGYQEQGLLGLAFHPDYASNGYFYVHYNDEDGNTVISRFSVSAGDPNVADEASEMVMMNIDQPFVNHNGGCIKFGPDGMLYIGMGDGGSAGDPGDRAQNAMLRLGKMLRIDVNGIEPFAIPNDNPFIGALDTLNEIWSIGLRNPWRFSFDPLTGNLWIADVGQNLHEELNVEPAGMGGLNYGWRCYEAFDEFNMTGCDGDPAAYTFPILDYPHNYSTGGFSITGGFVYRGTAFPGMYGYYLCADYVSGNWWWVNADAGAPWIFERMDDVKTDISAFGTDISGEMYCANLANGNIYHITDACGDFLVTGLITDYICASQEGNVDLTVSGGVAPYTFDWSTGDATEDLENLEAGTYTVTVTDAAGCVREQTFIVEELPVFTVTITIDGNTMTATEGVSYQWYLNGEAIDGATEQTYTATESGNYSVEVTNEQGCSEISDVTVLTVAIPALDGVSDIHIFPNPATELLSITFNMQQHNQTDLRILDLTGRVVWQKTIEQTGNVSVQLSVENWAAGMYIISVGQFKLPIAVK
ncbi:MAG TPA: PQQ-dependent sugar dehydrogenase [Chitinophagales bacterium]|nr:PQQ-dependent sugar dehydrogenase [Chitinophagales bacterium]